MRQSRLSNSHVMRILPIQCHEYISLLLAVFFFYLDKNVINTYTKKKDFTNRVLYSLLREVMIFIRIEGDININFAF